MKKRRNIRCLWMLLLIVCTPYYIMAGDYSYLYQELPFHMPVVQKPVFPQLKVSITEYGAVADGVTLNTEAINKAISEVAAKGGGTVHVPSGIWFTGPIVFQSNINLHLDKGALILFTPDFDAYPLVETVFEGLNTYRSQSPISGKNLENIAITGQGAINGSGDAWRPLKKAKVTEGYWKSVVNSGGVLKGAQLWFPTEKSLLGDSLTSDKGKHPLTKADWQSVKDYLRPVMISFTGCKNVLLEGVLFENSPSWNIHPLMCENIIIDGIEVRNPSYAQNGDGLDLESCKNALIVNSHFDVGDDAICIKSGKDEDGRRRGLPTENVIVDNCRVFKAHGGFVVGSEMSGGVRNISVSNCQFIGTDIGLRFKSARGRGGVVEHIYINNINMLDIVHEPLSFSLYYFTQPTDTIPAVDETTPVFKDITIKNITCRNANKAMFFHGIPEMNIRNIHIENAVITALYGAELRESTNVKFKNVSLNIEKGPVLILENVKDFNAPDLVYQADVAEVVSISGDRNGTIRVPRK